MDMIGYTSDASLDCLLESEAQAQVLVDTFAIKPVAKAPEDDLAAILGSK